MTYATDSDSIVNIFNVISRFELATGATLNKSKTNIYGIGIWKDKIDWPIPWLSTSDSNLKSLGIIFSNNYH